MAPRIPPAPPPFPVVTSMSHPWIADRTRHFDSSGIRKVFDLASDDEGPDQSLDRPARLRRARGGARGGHRGRFAGSKNGYSPTQGIAALRDKLQARIQEQYGHSVRQLFVTSGTSGGLVLAMLALVNPGDEVIVFDPYFVMYRSLVGLAGGECVLVDTLSRLSHRPRQGGGRDHAADQDDPVQQPGQSDRGRWPATREIRGLAELAAEQNIALVSDEIYRQFCYDEPFVSPARYNPQTIVIDGFCKSHAMTGWRLGFAHGPAEIIAQMVKLQQYTFVCAPQPVAMGGRSAHGRGHEPPHRRVPPQARPDRGGLGRRLRNRQAGRRVLRLPQGPWGTGSEFVRQGDREQTADHPRQHLQPATTRTFASPTPPPTPRSTVGWKCCENWPASSFHARPSSRYGHPPPLRGEAFSYDSAS